MTTEAPKISAEDVSAAITARIMERSGQMPVQPGQLAVMAAEQDVAISEVTES